MVVTMLVMAPISPRIAERFGNKASVAGGMLIAAGGDVLLLEDHAGIRLLSHS